MAFIPSPSEDEPLVLEKFGIGFQRTIMLAGGLAAIILPAIELRSAFFNPGLYTLFFGAILAGAWAVGAAFLYGAIFSQELRWYADRGVVTIERSSLVSHSLVTLSGADVARTEIREIEWDSKAPTFSVIVHTRDGERYETPDRPTAEAARMLELAIRRRLGI